MTIMGQQVCWGIRPEFETAPIVNLPDGAVVVRRRFRMKDVGTAVVRVGDALQRWRLGVVPGGLELMHMTGMNVRRQ